MNLFNYSVDNDCWYSLDIIKLNNFDQIDYFFNEYKLISNQITLILLSRDWCIYITKNHNDNDD